MKLWDPSSCLACPSCSGSGPMYGGSVAPGLQIIFKKDRGPPRLLQQAPFGTTRSLGPVVSPPSVLPPPSLGLSARASTNSVVTCPSHGLHIDLKIPQLPTSHTAWKNYSFLPRAGGLQPAGAPCPAVLWVCDVGGVPETGRPSGIFAPTLWPLKPPGGRSHCHSGRRTWLPPS